jgi:antitoxin ParD1/3/4
MNTLNLTMSDSLKEFVEAQAAAEGHSSAGEYVLAVLREAQKRKAWERVEELVLEGLNSGPAIVPDEAFWEAKRRRIIERYPEAAGPEQP